MDSPDPADARALPALPAASPAADASSTAASAVSSAADVVASGVAAAPGSAPAARPTAEDPVWRFIISPRWLLWHLAAAVGVIGMFWLGDWQYRRAAGGNGLSWAYTVEWPVFACFGVVFWAKTIRDEFRIRRAGLDLNLDITGAAHAVQLPAGLGIEQAGAFLPALPSGAAGWTGADGAEPVLASTWQATLARLDPEDWDDPELAAYNKKLAKLHAKKK